jgi:hypothetical protein
VRPVGGFKAVEALSVRVKDLDLESKPAHVFVRGEFTKTRADRIVFLTNEITRQLKTSLSYKYRKRRVCHNKDGSTITEYRTPAKEETDLVFAVYQEREGSNQNRRLITLRSFRRFVKTTISDLGYFDFSEYFIGHSGSTYWRKKDSEKADIFRKIEPYLTFLNVHQLERQGADIQSKIEELEELNQSFRERDKMKDDAIAHLSDQLMALTVRMQDLERSR